MHKRALYNLIQLQLVSIPQNEIHLADWQKENYRLFSFESLWEELKKIGIGLSPQEFQELGKQYDTPEEMTESMTAHLSPADQDHIYLILFELWRRLLHEKQSLTLFCDELDHQIIRYEKEGSQASREIQDALAYLQNILDKNYDAGIDPSVALPLLQGFCANNIENFLYNYVTDRIDERNLAYAKELLEGFQRYVKDKLSFNFLTIRIEISEETEDGYVKLEKLIHRLKEASHLDLSLEILSFLAKTGQHILFSQFAEHLLPHLKTEEDLRDFVTVCSTHFTSIELPLVAASIRNIVQQRSPHPLKEPLIPSDPAVLELKKVIRQHLPLTKIVLGE